MDLPEQIVLVSDMFKPSIWTKMSFKDVLFFCFVFFHIENTFQVFMNSVDSHKSCEIYEKCDESKVTKSEQKWPEVTSSDQKWIEVTRSD